MSNKELIEDLNHLRIKYGTNNLYRTLLKLLREEYEELSSLFGVSSGNPTSTFYPTSSTEFYKEYMEMAAQAAHERDMTGVALTGRQGGTLSRQLRETDVHVCVPHERVARIREVQHLVLHCLCDGIDTQLLGEQEPL